MGAQKEFSENFLSPCVVPHPLGCLHQHGDCYLRYPPNTLADTWQPGRPTAALRFACRSPSSSKSKHLGPTAILSSSTGPPQSRVSWGTEPPNLPESLAPPPELLSGCPPPLADHLSLLLWRSAYLHLSLGWAQPSPSNTPARLCRWNVTIADGWCCAGSQRWRNISDGSSTSVKRTK